MKKKAKKFGMGGMPEAASSGLDKGALPPAALAGIPVRPPQSPQVPVPPANLPFLQSVGLVGGPGMGRGPIGKPMGGMGGPRGGMGGPRGAMPVPQILPSRLPPPPSSPFLSKPPSLPPGAMYKKDGSVKAKKMASGGKVSSASKRADGCAVKGKTKGRFV